MSSKNSVLWKEGNKCSCLNTGRKSFIFLWAIRKSEGETKGVKIADYYFSFFFFFFQGKLETLCCYTQFMPTLSGSAPKRDRTLLLTNCLIRRPWRLCAFVGWSTCVHTCLWVQNSLTPWLIQNIANHCVRKWPQHIKWFTSQHLNLPKASEQLGFFGTELYTLVSLPLRFLSMKQRALKTRKRK